MLRWLLLPFSLIYGAVLHLRHWFYDVGVFKSTSPSTPTIVVGNLALGGTGKTPHVEYLLRLLEKDYRCATLSRGYGRHTKGFIVVSENDGPEKVGDEPLQMKSAFPQVTVAVCEKRVEGIKALATKFSPDVVLLDDAFQHRALRPGLSVLLMRYTPDGREPLFPVGRLRDLYSRHRTADILIVSKCPDSLSETERKTYATRFSLSPEAVFFSKMTYGAPEPVISGYSHSPSLSQTILITGLADASPLRAYCQANGELLHHFEFKDHHAFTAADVLRLKEKFDSFDAARPTIITTSKDAVKLRPLLQSLSISNLPLYVMPIEVELIAGKELFDKTINDYVGQNE